ncbi:Cysteine-rich protein 2-binding protein [Microbotryomycetes sp. JL221]|nr:Cysteine-rich protein 2-binding protein [Microbotryomycetes sp. JL221]
MLEAWLPLADLPATQSLSGTLDRHQHDSDVLPETCSILALRYGLQPLPFLTPPRQSLVHALDEPTTSWTRLLARIGSNIVDESHSIKIMDSLSLTEVKQLHDACLPLIYPSTFYSALLSNPHFICLVVTDVHERNKVVGAVTACIDPASFDTLGMATPAVPTIHLLSIVVDQDCRRLGLARKLIKTVNQRLLIEFDSKRHMTPLPAAPPLHERRRVNVVLHVASDNEQAMSLYQTLGFVNVRRVNGYYRKRRDGGSHQAIEMRGTLEVPYMS